MNLKKALEKFHEHEISVMHKEAILKLAATNNSTAKGIDAQLSAQIDSNQRRHRQNNVDEATIMHKVSCTPRATISWTS